jgi:hypothetical protein
MAMRLPDVNMEHGLELNRHLDLFLLGHHSWSSSCINASFSHGLMLFPVTSIFVMIRTDSGPDKGRHTTHGS